MSKGTVLVKPWTKKEEKLLAELYPIHRNVYLASVFGHSEMAIKKKATRLGLRKKKPDPVPPSGDRKWTKRQVERLREVYADADNRVLSVKFNRPIGSIKQKAHQLGLKKEKRRALTGFEKEFILKYHATLPVSKIAQRIGRPRDVVYKSLNSKWFTQMVTLSPVLTKN